MPSLAQDRSLKILAIFPENYQKPFDIGDRWGFRVHKPGLVQRLRHDDGTK